MTWSAAGGVLGGALGALGNKQRGPSLAQNMSDMGNVFGQNSALTANAGYRDLGPASYYPGNTYAGLSPQTQQALQQLMGGANSPALGAANNYLQGAASGQYLNSNPANAQLGGMAGPYGMGGYTTVAPQLEQMAGNTAMYGYNMVAPQLSDIAGRAGGYGANPAASGLDYFGSGGELNNNPWLDSMYGAASRSVTDNFRNSIAPSLASTFSAAGRTGSGASQGAFGQATQSLGNTLGDLGANLYGNAYESGRNRQLSALGTQGSLYNAGIGNQLSALSGLNSAFNQGFANQRGALSDINSAFNQGFSNQMGALGQLSANHNLERGLQNSAAGMAPAMNAANITALQAALQGGQVLDADAQARIDADRARFDFSQQAPRDYYSNLSGLYSGVQPARIQGQQPQPYNTLAGGLGGALVGSRIAGLFGQGSPTQIAQGFQSYQSPQNQFLFGPQW